jgi:hypothetical protein
MRALGLRSQGPQKRNIDYTARWRWSKDQFSEPVGAWKMVSADGIETLVSFNVHAQSRLWLLRDVSLANWCLTRAIFDKSLTHWQKKALRMQPQSEGLLVVLHYKDWRSDDEREQFALDKFVRSGTVTCRCLHLPPKCLQ